MKPINIYTLTRITNPSMLTKLERQMSKRKKYLKIKAWELEGLKAFSEKLGTVMENAAELNFYYSFVMPKLGKEFDLLRINDEYVVNVELKSGNVSDEMIRKQLLQNRYYLATLGKTMYFYTYVSSTDRLVRLSGSGRLLEARFEDLAGILQRQTGCCNDHIEDLFKEEKYLISPLTDPDKFLRQEYFLTSQQKDIKRQILKNIIQEKDIKENGLSVQGFTGFPGTGKTILLYDIAMYLSRREKVCVFHLGPHTKELEQLDERLKRIDFYYNETMGKELSGKPYSAILVDEGHRLTREALNDILLLAEKWKAPVIVSYDREDALSQEERKMYGADLIEAIPGYVRYHLTNRIRLNSELSSFIRCAMYTGSGNHRNEYPSVSLAYASSFAESARLLHNFEKEGYIYIWDDKLGWPENRYSDAGRISPNEPAGLKPTGISSDRCDNAGQNLPNNRIEVSKAVCREYARVVMLVDSSFVYDEKGYLRSRIFRETQHRQDSGVRNLFHGLSRAKEKIAIVVLDNEPVFERLLSIVQK